MPKMPKGLKEPGASRARVREGRHDDPASRGQSPERLHRSNSGLRFYRWQGRDLPSVTSVRRMAGVPFGLVSWQVSKVVTRAVEQSEELVAMLTREARPRERALETNRRKEAGRWLRAASVEERDAAAALGIAVHDAAATGQRPEDVDEEVRPRLRQYLDWLETSGATVVLAERQVWNLTLGYAGTFDLLARFPNGQIWMVDIKTGSGTYSEHVLQLLAYLMAEFIGEDDVVDEEATTLLHQVSGVAILHLADDEWSFIRPEADAQAWAAFRGLLAFAVWTAAHATTESFTLAAKSGHDNGTGP